MQQREGFSARTLALSTAAAELGRVILRAGQSGSVRAALLGNVLAAAALVLLAVFVSWNAARLRRAGARRRIQCNPLLLPYSHLALMIPARRGLCKCSNRCGRPENFYNPY